MVFSLEWIKTKKIELFYWFVLILFVILYSCIYLNAAFPTSEGWGAYFASLMDNGKIPYKDFYYNLPPLNLFIDYVLWKFSFGLIFIYRLWRLFERLVIASIAYKILSNGLSPKFSAMGAAIAIMIGSSAGFDLIGDYNQTAELLCLLLGLTLVKYSSSFNDLKKRKKWVFLAGIIGGLMFLTKQTIVFSCFIVFAAILILFKLLNKENNLFLIFLFTIAGAAIPIVIALLPMLYYNCLRDGIEQVFMDSSAKGSAYYIIIGKQLTCLRKSLKDIWPYLLLFISLFIIAPNRNKITSNKVLFIKYSLLLFAAFRLVHTCCKYIKIESRDIYSYYGYCSIAFLAMLVIYFATKKIESKYNNSYFILQVLIVFAMLKLNALLITGSIFRTSLNKFIGYQQTYIHWLIFFWFIYHLVVSLCKKKELRTDLVVYSGMAMASGWATLMSDGFNHVGVRTAFVSIPVILLIIKKEIVDSKNIFLNQYRDKIANIIFLFVFSICLSQKLCQPYAWWGNAEKPVWEKTKTSFGIQTLKGFKLSSEEKIKYDEITKVIEANTNKNSVIFSFPYVKVYNLFLNNYNLVGKYPILFYDVCSDKAAIAEAEELKKSPPDIIVWQSIEGCLEIHEKVYRGEKLCGQRKIIEWFESVKDGDYELIGQGQGIFVYKLKNNGIKKGYTFFENKELENHPKEACIVN